jgi:hypothetical protein
MINLQICKFLQYTAQLCLKTVINVVFLNDFTMYKFKLEHCIIFCKLKNNEFFANLEFT